MNVRFLLDENLNPNLKAALLRVVQYRRAYAEGGQHDDDR
jgi:hypothetical protein